MKYIKLIMIILRKDNIIVDDKSRYTEKVTGVDAV